MENVMNSCALVGNLGKDAETRNPGADNAVTTFSLATSDYVKGEETTQWHRVVVFGKATGFAARLKKGDKVGITGKIQYRTYEKDGATVYVTEIVAFNVEGYSAPKKNGGDTPPEEDF